MLAFLKREDFTALSGAVRGLWDDIKSKEPTTTNCDRCGERYLIENLSVCTGCSRLYCYVCTTDYAKPAIYANRVHSCGGEFVIDAQLYNVVAPDLLLYDFLSFCCKEVSLFVPQFCFTYRGKPIRWEVTNSAWHTAPAKAELEDFRFRDLRHTWASWHRQAGTTCDELKDLGGWKSRVMVDRYAKFATEHLAVSLSRFSHVQKRERAS